jgi:hypothetical protein
MRGAAQQAIRPARPIAFLSSSLLAIRLNAMKRAAGQFQRLLRLENILGKGKNESYAN